jgi:Sec-independent protein translocase protein TatA
MDILGIGIQEILFILVIALIIFGPKDIVKAGQTAGRFLR